MQLFSGGKSWRTVLAEKGERATNGAEMSVFSDFQRMWVQRFPQSSLSDAWEQDVRASLDRHKQKIAELSKELEQETLYVEYLERLLGDVEKYREAGGDPSTLFEANSPASAANLLSGAASHPREPAAGSGGSATGDELEQIEVIPKI
uniref:Uncharacterized protein n=1 Tax=Anopheles dirus TaxID=7168 RepID=A0A182N0C9_9DIPT